MADKKISELVEHTALSATDVFPVVDSGASATKRVTYDTLATEVRTESEPLTATTVTASGDVTADNLTLSGDLTLTAGLPIINDIPAFRVRSFDETGGYPTVLEFVDVDNTNIVSTANDRITVTKPGFYFVSATASYKSNGTDYRALALNIRVNGVDVTVGLLTFLYHVTSTTYSGISTSALVELSANDYIDFLTSTEPVYSFNASGFYVG